MALELWGGASPPRCDLAPEGWSLETHSRQIPARFAARREPGLAPLAAIEAVLVSDVRRRILTRSGALAG